MASIAFASLEKVMDLFKAVQSREELYLRVISSSRLAVGPDPLHPTHLIDLAREALVSCDGAEVLSGGLTRDYQSPEGREAT